MKMLWSQMKLQKDYFLFGGLVVIDMYVIGNIVHDVVIAFGDEKSVFCLGSVMAMIGLVMITFFGAGMQLVQTFHYAVAMGRTRKRMFPVCALAIFCTVLVLAVFLKLLYALEKLRLTLMYPGLKLEDVLSAALAWKYLLAYALAGMALSVFLGAMLSRFGKAAYVVWYLVIMLFCIGGPRLHTYLTRSHPDSRVTGWMLAAVRVVPDHIALVVIAVTVIFTGAAYLMVRRQQVMV